MKNHVRAPRVLFAHVLSVVLGAALSHAATTTISPGASIQVALDAVGNAGGGTVYMNPGNYPAYSVVKIPNNTTLKGVSTRPVITQASRLNDDVVANKSIPCSNVKADFISVNGGLTNAQMDAGTYNETFGIDISDQHQTTTAGTNGTIVNCYCTNASQGYVLGTISNARLDSAEVINCGGAPKDGKPGLHNIYIGTCNPFVGRYVKSTYCRTGMGFKVTDFDGTHTESSIVIEYNTCSNNYDRGIAVYDENPLTVQNNTCKNNGKSGINILRSTSGGKLLNNVCTGNPYVAGVSADIKLDGCANMTISGNTYSSKIGF